jgi:hypothetical protein
MKLLLRPREELRPLLLVSVADLAPYSVPTAPVGGKVQVSYKTRSRRAAILATDGLVTYNEAQPIPLLEKWAKEKVNPNSLGKEKETNMDAVMATPHGSYIKKRGFWIVTKTYTSRRKAVAVLQAKAKSITFGVDVEIPKIAQVGPSAKWWEATVAKPGWQANSNVSSLT